MKFPFIFNSNSNSNTNFQFKIILFCFFSGCCLVQSSKDFIAIASFPGTTIRFDNPDKVDSGPLDASSKLLYVPQGLPLIFQFFWFGANSTSTLTEKNQELSSDDSFTTRQNFVKSVSTIEYPWGFGDITLIFIKDKSNAYPIASNRVSINQYSLSVSYTCVAPTDTGWYRFALRPLEQKEDVPGALDDYAPLVSPWVYLNVTENLLLDYEMVVISFTGPFIHRDPDPGTFKKTLPQLILVSTDLVHMNLTLGVRRISTQEFIPISNSSIQPFLTSNTLSSPAQILFQRTQINETFISFTHLAVEGPISFSNTLSFIDNTYCTEISAKLTLLPTTNGLLERFLQDFAVFICFFALFLLFWRYRHDSWQLAWKNLKLIFKIPTEEFLTSINGIPAYIFLSVSLFHFKLLSVLLIPSILLGALYLFSPNIGLQDISAATILNSVTTSYSVIGAYIALAIVGICFFAYYFKLVQFQKNHPDSFNVPSVLLLRGIPKNLNVLATTTDTASQQIFSFFAQQDIQIESVSIIPYLENLLKIQSKLKTDKYSFHFHRLSMKLGNPIDFEYHSHHFDILKTKIHHLKIQWEQEISNLEKSQKVSGFAFLVFSNRNEAQKAKIFLKNCQAPHIPDLLSGNSDFNSPHNPQNVNHTIQTLQVRNWRFLKDSVPPPDDIDWDRLWKRISTLNSGYLSSFWRRIKQLAIFLVLYICSTILIWLSLSEIFQVLTATIDPLHSKTDVDSDIPRFLMYFTNTQSNKNNPWTQFVSIFGTAAAPVLFGYAIDYFLTVFSWTLVSFSKASISRSRFRAYLISQVFNLIVLPLIILWFFFSPMQPQNQTENMPTPHTISSFVFPPQQLFGTVTIPFYLSVLLSSAFATTVFDLLKIPARIFRAIGVFYNKVRGNHLSDIRGPSRGFFDAFKFDHELFSAPKAIFFQKRDVHNQRKFPPEFSVGSFKSMTSSSKSNSLLSPLLSPRKNTISNYTRSFHDINDNLEDENNKNNDSDDEIVIIPSHQYDTILHGYDSSSTLIINNTNMPGSCSDSDSKGTDSVLSQVDINEPDSHQAVLNSVLLEKSSLYDPYMNPMCFIAPEYDYPFAFCQLSVYFLIVLSFMPSIPQITFYGVVLTGISFSISRLNLYSMSLWENNNTSHLLGTIFSLRFPFFSFLIATFITSTFQTFSFFSFIWINFIIFFLFSFIGVFYFRITRKIIFGNQFTGSLFDSQSQLDHGKGTMYSIDARFRPEFSLETPN